MAGMRCVPYKVRNVGGLAKRNPLLCLVFSGAERDSPESEFRGKTRLFAKFVRRDAIKLPVALDRNRLLTIGVNGVIGSFAK